MQEIGALGRTIFRQLQQEAAKGPFGHRVKQPSVLVNFCSAWLFCKALEQYYVGTVFFLNCLFDFCWFIKKENINNIGAWNWMYK